MSIAIAVFGAGRWGRHFIRTFAHHPDAHLVAVIDPHREHREACRTTLNLNADLWLVASWDELPDSLTLDAVVIATPATTHYTLITTALQRGYHVLAEKPLTLDPQDCATLTALAQRQGKQLFIDHTYLFNPAVLAGGEVVRSQQLGTLRYGYGARTHLGPVRQDVDVLWDLAIHDLAIFNHWLGQRPEVVQGVGQGWLQPGIWDQVWATLTYPTGVRVQLQFCWANPDKQRRSVLVGDRGVLIFDEMQREQPLIVQRGHVGPAAAQFPPLDLATERVPVPPGEPLAMVCDRFLASIHTQTPDPAASGQMAQQLVATLTALSQSLTQGGTPQPVAYQSTEQ
ncbi:Gfo/Idh/MocA family oxidoreductase [Spirulina major CS-329]|uniref:Gfo/Idh/MocA family protein n=1 Tax=Spirulina TaxID=1154 RepID=UPI00233033C4|nr:MULTISPECIES: Gfo/Idh/MocA family oxidoreductase [Spirulina]MDB9494814.1 Gfo/Idh/MocA family oxidoreductase [Spirulina subsalsa CS-330]MDB9504890.1 Gfo/Idh/MocA family oxidoreductase [Spirulina major CS-329]